MNPWFKRESYNMMLAAKVSAPMIPGLLSLLAPAIKLTLKF